MFYERKRHRLQDFDYSVNNFYFVTICCQDREKYFGTIENGKSVLNHFGRIIEKQWLWLEENYSYVLLDEYIIMPEHFHGILIINRDDEYNPKRSLLKTREQTMEVRSIAEEHIAEVRSRPDPTTEMMDIMEKTTTPVGIIKQKIKPLSQLIGAFKTTSSKAIHQIESEKEFNSYFKWQKSYYERIIRDERGLNNVRQYIINNPLNWEKDIENTNCKEKARLFLDKQKNDYYEKIFR